MCGRFTISIEKEELRDYISDSYKINSLPDDFVLPNYNVSPGNNIISIINDGKEYRIGLLKWGYLPPFTVKDRNGFINARAETIFEKPSFKNAALKQRCIIIADGYYEWNKDKQPMRIFTDGSLFSMAGIWNTIKEKDGKKTHTVAIITTVAKDSISIVHNRMPVILSRDTEKMWLNTQTDIEELKAVLQPYQGQMNMYPVSKEVNYSNNNYEGLIKEILQDS